MTNLQSPLTELNKIGQANAKKLKKLGLSTIEDLLFYFPFRYEKYKKTEIKNIEPGQNVNIEGTIEMIQNRRSSRRGINITEALISDEKEQNLLKAIWFNQPFIKKNLKAGDSVSLSGKIETYQDSLVIKSPEYEKNSTPAIHTRGLVPFYHLTAGLTQKQIRFLISQTLKYANEVKDFLPSQIKEKRNLLDLAQALKKIHFPDKLQKAEDAKKRLAFDELFVLQIRNALAKIEAGEEKATAIDFFEKETKKFVDSLGFNLTDDQRKTAWEIILDMGKTVPMRRLLQGDVGSGKTITACLAMLNASLNKKQSALLAPTEILAKQHFLSFKKIFAGFNIKIALLTNSFKEASWTDEKKNEKIILEADIIIGTHALIQEKIKFRELCLAVIDEQHRFGVKQRKTLTDKNGKITPHLLSMTATPIPRSLSLAIYGDLALSTIKQMPKGRKKIITIIAGEEKRNDAYKFIEEKIKEGRQAFVICPLISASDKLGVKSVEEEYEKLNKNIFPDLKIKMLHGKLKPEEKEKIMNEFAKNKINILIATSVVEVGIDIPNAAIMAIEGAERFGLSQLHQFRGRVGRGEHQSYCILFSDSDSEATSKRLEAMAKYDNGFDLAKIDLELRGPGEVYGLNQKGFLDLKIASLFDFDLIKKAKESAEEIIKTKSDIKKFPALAEKVENLQKNIHLE